jgi:trigger factor
LEITLDKKDQTNARLKVKLQEADYAPIVDEKIKEYSKKAQVKGFRPGKVPPGMIRKLYGKGILVDQINQLLHESVNNYIKTENLRILGDPLPERADENAIDWDHQKEFEFSYELGLLPDFDIPVDQISIDAYKVEADDKTVADTYEQMQKQFGESTNPDLSEENDFLYGELKQDEGDFNTKTLIPINKVKDGQEKFVAVKPEDEIKFDLRQAFGDDDANLAHVTGLAKDLVKDLQGSFTFKVEKINRTSPAELNQEFFDKVLGKDAVSSTEEFDAKVREIISENYNRESDKMLNFQLIDALVKQTSIDLPEEFFKRWLLATNEGKLTAEQVEQNFDQYTRELKWSMIRNKVNEEQGLKVTEEEVLSRTKQKLMAQFNLPPQMEEEMDDLLNNYADNYLKQNNGRNFVTEYEEILAQKVLQNLKERITVTEKTVTAEEFRNLSFD